MDYYKILEVPENADISEIKKKYRKMVMKYHPDRNAGDEKTVKKISRNNRGLWSTFKWEKTERVWL